MEPLVSIIVPVYNAADYIRRCVDSILRQDYTNLEIILIDDGSTDGTGEILDAYAQRDERVRVVHQENEGVSAARNRGISLAEGDYLQFADSDDWMTPDATRLMQRAAEDGGCDLVIADFYRVNGKRVSQKGDIDTDHVMDRMEFASYMIENPADFYYGVLWNKLYKSSVVKEHQLRMDTDLNWCEDFLFNLEFIRHATSLCAIQAPVYYYFKRKGSLVNQNSGISNTVRMKINVFEYYSNFYKDVYEDSYDDIKGKVHLFLISAATDGLVMPSPVHGSTKLGNERTQISGQAAYDTEGIFTELYRLRKLLEYHLDRAASLKKMTADEMFLLLLFKNSTQFQNQKEIAELTGLTMQKANRALQRLKRRDLIILNTAEDGSIWIEFTDKSGEYLDTVEEVMEDFEKDLNRDLSEEETEAYRHLLKKMENNIRERLMQLG